MTLMTERYLAVVLRSIPERQRADVDRELRSSIADAVEDRVAAGEDRPGAERAVLEGLGEPSRLAAGYTGRPLYLIGPEFYPAYRDVLLKLVAVVMPIVAVALTVVELAGGVSYVDALLAGFGAAISTGVHVAFWVTLFFMFLERAEVTREARTEMANATGRWTVDRLPEEGSHRVGAGETVGEVLTTMLTIGGLLFLRDLSWVTRADGEVVPLFDPALTTFWFPVLAAILALMALIQVVVYMAGRWTITLASGYTILQLAFAVPVVTLALRGTLINPTFAAEVGWPPLAAGDGLVMLALAAVVTFVSAWEIFDAFRRARRAHRTQRAVAAGQIVSQ
ncbi:MAG: permease prefix domain 1-containing protein [Candidatus Limnocylindria bacterium]